MSKGLNLEIPTLDEIFGMDAQNGVTKQIVKLPLNQIGDFPNHPFKVNHDESLNKLSESIKENGVIIPIIVRRIGENKYQVISGHRRKEASKQAGLKEISAIVEDLDDDTATILMVDSNMQREKILPSERAFAYKMKMEALKHQGKRNDLTLSPVATKLDTAKNVAEENGESRDQVFRYIHLTNLIPEILTMVDEEKIAFRPAVEISYLTDEEQYVLLDSMDINLATPSLAQAIDMKKRSQEGTLTSEKIDEIMSTEKPNQVPVLRLKEEKFDKYFPSNVQTPQQKEEFLLKAIIEYSKKLKRDKEKNNER